MNTKDTMSERIEILRVEAVPLDIGLHVPFGISGGAQAVARNVLVTVVLSDGTRGIGEAAPFTAYNGETQEQALTVLGASPRVAREAAGW